MAPEGRRSLTWIPDDVEFYPHQIEGVRWMAAHASLILADDMGLGKSLQAITAFAVDVEQGYARRMLVVAPVTLKENWMEEVEKFTTFTAIELSGTPAKRSKQLAELTTRDDWHILVVNYEQVKPHLDEINAIGFDVVAYDEAHMMKNHKAARTKAAHGIRASRFFCLTGSPMLNQVNELWSLLYRVDPANTPKYWAFVSRYCVFGGYKDKQIVGVKNEAELLERLQTVMLRRTKDMVLDLPEKQIIKVMCDLTPEQRDLYNRMKDEGRLFDEDDPTENALTKYLRLKQVAGTTLPFTGEDHSGKLDVAIPKAVELAEGGHKLVVFTQFRDMQKAFHQRISEATPGVPYYELNGDVPQADRQGIVRRWAANEGPGVICCMLQVAGVGLNMTAARHGFFLDKLYVPKLNEQAQDRMYRIGADLTQPVQIYEFIARRTVEQRIENILTTKSTLFGTVVDTSDFKRKLIQALEDEDQEES